jgi:predicted ATPase
VEVLGVNQLAKGLDNRFQLLTRGRRSALPRHQTLRATLDWSYECLPEPERVVLRRLSVFAGPFELKAAVAVVTSSDIVSTEIVDYIASLVSKSLISADVGGQIVHYRLLDTTRAYALEKLTKSGEVEQVARRHAEFYRDFFTQTEADWEQLTAERVGDFSFLLADVRAALDWAFSPTGDLAIGVALTAGSVPLWVQMSFLDECRRRVEQALSRLTVETERDARSEMKLYGALGLASLFTKGPDLKTGATWAKVQELADSLGDAEYQMRALWGQWVYRYGRGEHGAALALARQFKTFAANNVNDRGDELIADRLIATSLHFLGDQINARRHIQRMLNGYAASGNRSRSIRFGFHQEVQGRTTLARILCVQGFPDQAMHIAQSNVEDIPLNGVLSLCVALTEGAFPIALSVGNLAAAGRFLAMLLDNSAKHELTLWNRVGHCLQGMLLIKRGDVVNGVQLLQTSLDQLRGIGYGLRRTDFLGALAEGLAAAGQVTEGLEIIQEALERSQHEEERWNVAELLRIKGDLVLVEDAPNAATSAEALFLESLDWARRQKVLTWELRTSISLARLQHAQNRTQEARDLLAPIYGRFNEGFEAADLKTANGLLEQLA